MVAEHRTRVATAHRELRRRCAAAGAGLAPLEEVTEEDGVDVVLGVRLERLLEPVDVTLDVADDQGVPGHALRISVASRPRRLFACAPPAPVHG